MPRHKSDPLLSALIKKLPPVGMEWPVENQLAWLNLMAMAFGAVYGGDAASRLGSVTKPMQAAPVPFKSVEFPLYIDKNGYARKRGGQRILPKDVTGTLHDLRGEDGDLGAIVWADDSTGIDALGEGVLISAA